MSSLAARSLALLCCGFGAAAAMAPDDALMLAAGQKLFAGQATPPCALCHTLAKAGTTGAIGPNLDDLQPNADRVAKALKSGIGVMPSYRATLTEDQIQALAKFVAKASGAAD